MLGSLSFVDGFIFKYCNSPAEAIAQVELRFVASGFQGHKNSISKRYWMISGYSAINSPHAITVDRIFTEVIVRCLLRFNYAARQASATVIVNTRLSNYLYYLEKDMNGFYIVRMRWVYSRTQPDSFHKCCFILSIILDVTCTRDEEMISGNICPQKIF